MHELRRAAGLLRELAKNYPRGPWRWGDPDRPHESDTGRETAASHRWPGPGDPHVQPGADPLGTFDELVHSRPGHPATVSPVGFVGPSVAGPLAGLLDALADQATGLEGPCGGVEPFRSALQVAAAIRA